MLKDITLLVFDIQDVGVRYYTYSRPWSTSWRGREAADPSAWSSTGEPINGRVVEGPLNDPDLQSFTAPHRSRCEPGSQIGEFARLAAAERKIPVSLTVVPLVGWDRDRWFDETGLPWVNPSRISDRHPGVAHSGVGLLEARKFGRRTCPSRSSARLDRAAPASPRLSTQGLRRCEIRPDWFRRGGRHTNISCGGSGGVTYREAIRPVTLLRAGADSTRASRDQFRPESIPEPPREPVDDVGLPQGRGSCRLVAWARSTAAAS